MRLKAIFAIIFVAFLAVGCQGISQISTNGLSENQDSDLVTTTPDLVEPVAVESEVIGLNELPAVPLPEEEPATVDAKIDQSIGIIPGKIEYPVAFVSQAPFGVWDELHKEACEEASMITAAKYFKSEAINAHIMEQGILDLVSWEKSQGYQVDLTAQEAVDILNSYFGLAAKLITIVDVSTIKDQLIQGNLVIVPLAGRILDNPYFQNPGPIYHMLVIRGFDDQTGEFITNEVGTRRGDGFRYAYVHLVNSIHDWDHELAQDGMAESEISRTPKAIISVGAKIN